MKTQQTGFSLLELLIAIAISMVAMVAVSAAYLVSKAGSRVQEMQVRLIQDGRFGNSMPQRVISQAGYRETPSTDMAADRISIANNVITVKFRSDGANQMVCNGTTPAVANQTLVIQRLAAGNKLQCLFDTNNDGSAVGDGTLDWIAPATAGAGNGTEVIDFSVKMGIDTGPANTNENLGCGTASANVKPRDCIVDSYESALPVGPPAVTAAQIVAVKVCWMLRSEATDASIIKGANVTDCAGAAIANTQNDRKLYRTFNTTVLLRNR